MTAKPIPAIKERPILFNGEMVKAILEGRKTQTRRIIKPQPIYFAHDGTLASADAHCHPFYKKQRGIKQYCEIGDRLWVRESWAIDQCGRRVSLKKEAWSKGWPIKRLRYCATDEPPSRGPKEEPYWWNKRPSIHMPRWASRINLEITDIRVERVQDISFEGASAEGTSDSLDPAPIRGFKKVWNSINEKRGYGWDANPWTWALTFKVV